MKNEYAKEQQKMQLLALASICDNKEIGLYRVENVFRELGRI